ncbi:hypothetical protein F7725_012347 [Dissostichus mawsoni]|uniref:Uncharacterized protein n=1 Tax=Dissostichus mawsoni TaxID=36200 RepID=A0A7J5YMF6_DISMA|nr:hypothetical protein F7725_012347 [Dissostichus mawsoni]
MDSSQKPRSSGVYAMYHGPASPAHESSLPTVLKVFKGHAGNGRLHNLHPIQRFSATLTDRDGDHHHAGFPLPVGPGSGCCVFFR